MFTLSNKSEYALKAVLELCYHRDDEAVPLTDIAARRGIPLKYLEQIMLVIKKAGLIESRRGLGGGFSLKKKPEEMTLGSVIRTVEGNGSLRSAEKHETNFAADQAIEEIWQQVTQAVSDIIDRVTFADIMRRIEELDTHKEFNFII